MDIPQRRFSFGMDDLNGRLIQNFFAELLGTMFLIIFCVGSANSTALTALGENSPAYYLSISLAFGLGKTKTMRIALTI